ncbi:contact-dependent growth inhibition system immunity protein [Sphingomonas sp.]|uniref:contact-dependent growth inhibition system immunity protein n=1 Tax=Sphingomonas sp. TaxID=28214 RepID=UPI001D1D38BB|nr:contact-dependent growth inhibition system immunity protein [Sphingomonas sp.]MBX9797443.1 hypothetical protein [Sphingomonas sp.]
MSRKRYQLRTEIEQRWPTLYQFLAAYCHQEWPCFHESIGAAIDTAISHYTTEARQRVLKEWRNCNETLMSVDDVRFALNDGFGVCMMFRKPIDGRNFWNTVYDKLIVSVRDEFGERWNP